MLPVTATASARALGQHQLGVLEEEELCVAVSGGGLGVGKTHREESGVCSKCNRKPL